MATMNVKCETLAGWGDTKRYTGVEVWQVRSVSWGWQVTNAKGEGPHRISSAMGADAYAESRAGGGNHEQADAAMREAGGVYRHEYRD